LTENWILNFEGKYHFVNNFDVQNSIFVQNFQENSMLAHCSGKISISGEMFDQNDFIFDQDFKFEIFDQQF